VGAGTYELLVNNYGTTTASYHVAFEEQPPLGFGGESSAVPTMNGSPVSVTGGAPIGQYFTIDATPLGGQDLVLQVFDSSGVELCWADNEYQGSESCEVLGDDTGEFSVTVSGYSSSDQRGDVRLDFWS
jgi:hypothetical protein